MTLPDPLFREVRIEPGYNKRAEGKGVHGMEFRFILRGAAGAITWKLNTGWVPGEGTGANVRHLFPSSGGVAAHSPVPARDWWLGPDSCDVLPGGQCWGDAGYSVGDRVLEAMHADGHEGIWRELEAIYADWLGPETHDSEAGR